LAVIEYDQNQLQSIDVLYHKYIP